MATPVAKLDENTTLADFEVGVTLGTGSFGRVRLATHKANQSIWAIKMLKKVEVVRLQQVDHMISEKTILKRIAHPFIVNLSATFQDSRYLYMALEYICGENSLPICEKLDASTTTQHDSMQLK